MGLGQGLGGPRLQGRGDPGGAGHGPDRFFGLLQFESQTLDGEFIVGQAAFAYLLPGQVAQGLGQEPAADQDHYQGRAHAIQVPGPVAAIIYIDCRPGNLEITRDHEGDPTGQQSPDQLDRQAGEAGERPVVYHCGRPESGLGHHHASGQAVEDKTGAAGQQPGAGPGLGLSGLGAERPRGPQAAHQAQAIAGGGLQAVPATQSPQAGAQAQDDPEPPPRSPAPPLGQAETAEFHQAEERQGQDGPTQGPKYHPIRPGEGHQVQPLVGPVGEAEEGQPTPGQPLVDHLGEDIGNHPQADKGQAIKEEDVIYLSLEKGAHGVNLLLGERPVRRLLEPGSRPSFSGYTDLAPAT